MLLATVILGATARAAPRLPSEASLCAESKLIVVGRVTSVDTFVLPWRNGNAAIDFVYENSTFSIEATLRGDAGNAVSVLGVKGQIEDDGTVVGTMETEGRHYHEGDLVMLFLVHPPTGVQEPFSPRRWLRYYSFEISNQATLPPVAVMRAILDEHCAPSPHQGTDGATAPYLSILPKYLLDWCQHY